MKLTSFIQETITDAFKTLTSKEGIKNLYRVSLYRNAGYLMLNSVVLSITGFFFWILAARLYPTEAVGLSSAAISAMGLLAMLSTLGLDYGLIRFLPSSKDPPALINSCFTIGSLVSVALSAIFLLGLPFWSPSLLLIRDYPLFFLAFILFTVATALQTFTQQTFIAHRRAGFTLIQGFIFGFLRFIPLFILLAYLNIFGIFISWGLATGIAVTIGISFISLVQEKFRPFPALKKEVINELLHFSFQNYLANLLWALPGFILPLMVVNILGAEQNAYFFISWRTAGLLNVAGVAISFSLFAEGSYEEEKLRQNLRRSFKFILLLLVPFIFIILLVGDKILLAFGQVYSKEATNLLRLLALSSFPLSLNFIYFSKKRVEKNIKPVILLVGLIAGGTLGLSATLLPWLGILGVGVAWLLSQGVAGMAIARRI